jgi:hypothetical protein
MKEYAKNSHWWNEVAMNAHEFMQILHKFLMIIIVYKLDLKTSNSIVIMKIVTWFVWFCKKPLYYVTYV